MASLRITNGPLAGQTVDIRSEIVLGREDADVTIEDAEVSRRHAVLRVLGDAVEVEDLGSRNGTFVDGERIEGPTRVVAGSRIRLGTTWFQVDDLPRATRTQIDDLPRATRTQIGPAAELQATLVGQETHDEPTLAPAPAPPPGAVVVPGVIEPAEAGIVAAPPAAAPVEPFRPPARRHRRGLASRSWVPVVLSFGTVVLTAVALVVYFATR